MQNLSLRIRPARIDAAILRAPRMEETRMVTIGMNYFVVPGKEQVFEDACAKVVQTMEGIDGHDSSSIYREIGDGDPTYLIVSRWKNEQAFKDFVASDAFKKVTNWGAMNILSGRPQHTTYQHD
jgi:heme-degrading monooxygenase HmoA